MSRCFVDTHAHLSSAAFATDRLAVLTAALEAGVAWVLNVADTLETSLAVAAWAAQEPQLYAAVGIHPHDAASWGEQSAAVVRSLAAQEKVVAIGEIGLDYHYDFSPREQQQAAFAAQVRLAGECELPIVVHNREADQDTLAILAAASSLHGVMHCFWSDAQTAHAALEMGLYLGVGGPVTFANTQDLRSVIKQVPLERIVLETDAPYLAPKPYRGKRNEPAFVERVAVALAELHNKTVDYIAQITTENAEALFLGRKKDLS